MDIVYQIFISWFIILIGYIVFVKIISKLKVMDKFRSYMYSHHDIKLITNPSVNFIIHMGIYFTICVIPLLFIGWLFVGLMTFGLSILYLGLGIYFRPHIFSEESVYDEPVDFGVAGIPQTHSGISTDEEDLVCIGYYELVYEPLATLGICSLLMAIQSINFMTHFPYNIWLFILLLFEFFNVTLLIFPEKVNEHFEYDIRSQKGYSVYGPLSIFWQLMPMIIWFLTPLNL